MLLRSVGKDSMDDGMMKTEEVEMELPSPEFISERIQQ